jgi:toxin CptA
MHERLSLTLRPSGSLAWLLSAAYALAAIAIWLAPFASVLSLAGTLVLAGALVRDLRRHAWLTAAAAVVALDLREDCAVTAFSRGGEEREYQITRSSFVAPFLAVLNLRCEAWPRARFVLVVPGSLDADSFRRLRVWLLCRCNGRLPQSGVTSV